MSAPAMIYLALMTLGLGIEMAKHGQPKTGFHSFWLQLFVSLLVCGLLFWGGFFAKVAP